VNYEDRTDLLPPEQVVSAPLLAELRLIPDAARLMTLFLDMQGRSVSSAAYEAIVLRAAEDIAPGRGAPAGEWAAEEDAMLCGYRFGRLALGSLPRRRPVSPEEIRRRADSMYLYGLFVGTRPPPMAGYRLKPSSFVTNPSNSTRWKRPSRGPGPLD
jgi:hypothetical protein